MKARLLLLLALAGCGVDPDGGPEEAGRRLATDPCAAVACAEGLQDHDHDFVCLPDCTTADLDCVNGFCVDGSGTAVCACFAGWKGERCDEPVEG